MFGRDPSIRIDKVDNLEINAPLHPLWEEVLLDYVRRRREIGDADPIWPTRQPLRLSDRDGTDKSLVATALDYVGKAISILSGVAVIIFVAFLWSGRSALGSVQIGTLLTIVSVTFFGGLISVGGVKMFAIEASLRRARERVAQMGGCPFMAIFVGQSSELRRPGNPFVCVKCPLGIDTSTNVQDRLIHACRVYPQLHREWLQLPGAERVLQR